jgi:hypothetical protein
MRLPTRERWERNPPGALWFCLGYLPRTPRKFYKYTWQIWTPDFELEGHEFLRYAMRMSTAAFMARYEEMFRSNLPGWIYRHDRPREGPGTPFDRNHLKWKDVEFAPSWDDDPDPVWNGHK